MDTQRKELNLDDISTLVLLQSLDDFSANDGFGEEITSLSDKFDRYIYGLTPAQEELDSMEESIENLIQAKLMERDDSGELTIIQQGKEIAKKIIDNELFDGDMVKLYQDSMAAKEKAPENDKKVNKWLMHLREWVKKNPGDTASIISAVLQSAQLILTIY